MRTAFAVAIGVGALLLFQVQFVLGKQVLPWFGGVPAVWSTCLVFFQTLLLGGYAYAHGLTRLPVRRQVAVHLVLLTLAAISLAARSFGWPSPITPDDAWKPLPEGAPVRQILGLLGAAVGLPYLLLASTGPLLQRWWAAVWPDRSPYRLYALSNLGSLAGLLTYPFLVERLLAVPQQGWLWTTLFIGYGGATLAAALTYARQGEADRQLRDTSASVAAPAWREQLLWAWLAAAPAALLQSTTAWLTIDVAAVPLLWMAPLALYLVTFIVAFEYPKVYHRLTWTMLLLVALAGAIAAAQADTDVSPAWHMGAGLAVLLAAGMFCHGELGMRAPAPVHLTRFYLVVAAGGAAGSAATALLPPVLSTWVVEYPVSLFAVALAVFAVYASAFRPADTPRLPWWSRLLAVALVPTMVGLARFTIASGREQQSSVIVSSRNFFGWIRVRESEAPGGGTYRRLLHGNTVHGNQFREPPRRHQATTYYTTGSGVGQAVEWLRDFGPGRLHVGVVGLGAGTMASYAQAGDVFRFYEIDPQVVALSRGPEPVFTYVADAAGEVRIVQGDARLSLERESDNDFDLLVLDAFSSDAVPAHLLTVEAFGLYARHLRDARSLLAVHISNRFLELEGIVRSGGATAGFSAVVVEHYPDGDGEESTTWVLLARDGAVLEAFGDPDAGGGEEVHVRPWTDAWSNIFDVIAR
jgi:hypothetical protein